MPWTYPTDVIDHQSTQWSTVQEIRHFRIQKYQPDAISNSAYFKNIWASVQNVFDVKQPTFRLLFHLDTLAVPIYRMVAASDTLATIQKDWTWIIEHVSKELDLMEDPVDKESFAMTKFMSLVQSKDGDEISLDAKYRAAARSWRQLFRMPDSERFVNCRRFEK